MSDTGKLQSRRRLGLAAAAGLLFASAGLAAQRSGAVSAAPCRESIPDLYTRVSPAVVSIMATAFNPYDRSNPVERHGGSGVLFDGSGLVLTNSHVVYGHQAISVTLDDGTVLPGQIVGADPLFDIAIVRVKPPSPAPLPVARFGESDRLRVGEEIYAIGNPFGLDQTLTRGIVSGVNRVLPGATSRPTRRSIPATRAGRWSMAAGTWSASRPPSCRTRRASASRSP